MVPRGLGHCGRAAGTKRVTMDGIGGGSQEVTWQRYNGVRRSKFITEGDEYGAR
jgi:hypothetical protein